MNQVSPLKGTSLRRTKRPSSTESVAEPGKTEVSTASLQGWLKTATHGQQLLADYAAAAPASSWNFGSTKGFAGLAKKYPCIRSTPST